MTERFAGRRVVITGGSSGIGLACAEEFVRRGASVGVIARDRTRLEIAREALEQLRVSPGQVIAAASADLADRHEAKRAIAELSSAGLEPDVLVNCAGVILPGEFCEMPYEMFGENMASYFAAVNCCRAVAPGMVERGRGHIVNVSSVAGFLGIYGYTAYSAAKYALMGFTEALRFEMRPRGVKVSVVCPPDTDTPGLAFEKTLRPSETDAIAGGIKAVPAHVVARAIVRGVATGRYYIIPDALSRFYFRLKGVWPELFFRMVDADVAKARKAAGK